MGSAHYQARWLERSDEVDPWDWWPAWDIREAEDVLELWLPEQLEDDEAGVTLREYLPLAFREEPEWEQRLRAALERSTRADAPGTDELLAAMSLPEARIWELDLGMDEAAFIAMRERCLFQNLASRAFPGRFVSPQVTRLEVELAAGSEEIPRPQRPGDFTLESLAVRLIAEAAAPGPLSRLFGTRLSEPMPSARELVVSVTMRPRSESDSTHATMCIVLPTYLAPGIKPGRQSIDTWAFGD